MSIPDNRPYRLLGLRLPIAQIHQRGGRFSREWTGRCRRSPILYFTCANFLLEFDNQTFGRLFSNAWSRNQACHIARMQRILQLINRNTRQNIQGQARADAVHAAKQQKIRLLLFFQKAEQLEGVFSRMGMDEQADRFPDSWQMIEGLQRHQYLIADAANVDNELLRGLFVEHSVEARDHRSCRTSVLVVLFLVCGEHLGDRLFRKDIAQRASLPAPSTPRLSADLVEQVGQAGSATVTNGCRQRIRRILA